MNIEEYRSYCLTLKGADEEMPFDNKTLVFTIRGKMFTSTNIETFELVNVKCDPEEAVLIREKHAAVIPGYYMNKKHWNSIVMDNTISDELIKEWIGNSYKLVLSKLPKKVQIGLSECG